MDSAVSPPYVSFKTMTNLFARLEEGPIPPRIDKGYLVKLSGASQSSLLSALRWFKLIDSEGTVSDELKRMATDAAFRKQHMLALVEQYYPDQQTLATLNGTDQQLVESFSDVKYSASTLRRAIVFYLATVDYSGATKSPLFKAPKQAQSSSGPKAPRPPGGTADAGGDTNDGEEDDRQSGGEVRLPSGGTVTLSVSVDLFKLTGTERDFVFGLIDQIQSFKDDGSYDEAR